MADAILTLNCGSSSIKFALFKNADLPKRIAYGRIEELETAPHFQAFDGFGGLLSEKRWQAGTHETFFRTLLSWVEEHLGEDHLLAAGHRIVHGGEDFFAPCVLTEGVLERLKKLERLAPLHQPHNLAAVDAVTHLRPGLRQIGCFDTAFHRTMAPTVRRYGLPQDQERAGIHRYGFHGLSYEYIAGRLKELAPEHANNRILVAHLGNGASLCAIHKGCSVDTTMGFSTLDGLLMGTRPGSTDPGILLYLLRQGMDVSTLEDMLYHRSGLLGVSGISSDMRVLLESQKARAADAVDLFVFRVAREAAALIMTMGGIDGVVFTAGIGEKSAEIRQRICAKLSWLGVSLDADANAKNFFEISDSASKIKAWVVPTDEELIIARHAFSLVS